ncbi:4-hydroxy-3-methylbut-2-en-1-yl diphosphate synthase, partial [Streptomyces syringium]
ADLGVSCGNGKGQIFRQGQVITTVPEHQIIDTLVEEALRLTKDPAAAEAGEET